MTRLLSAPVAPATRILGLGHYRPSNVITNHDLVARGVDTNDEWIRTRVGVVERRYANPDETVVDMAESAGSKAMAAAGLSAADIDMVIVATCTMTTPIPAAAPHVASRLGIEAPGAYDISSGCSGFVYSLNAASSAVLTGQARNVLVIASERFSGWLDFSDRSTCIILGDGAGAAVVGAAPETGIGPIVWGSDGAQFDAVAIDEESRFFRQEGQAVYRWATSEIAPVGIEACHRAGIEPKDLAAFIPHQANLRIIDQIAKKIGADNAVVARDIVTSGNTSAATIPLAFSRMVEAGDISSGDPVLLLGFGSGLSYAGQVVLCP
ncbi:3-oxoacyl-[acyl-carrier-protein] synthase III [Jatrophihabitans sp. GAS493]|uniref:beta-ketoacyl-ACP synthase III n=1 Tax=Jatrophihabitans sp. GAS493 TaxID=1907575 RepID=UPI000BB94614|nr:beta-ketoacyl-ACP synthase III [Jatrophihabitans sp. GAS493]SOD74454.1 3-oxoacyl-[acyl-carrier-protein] synthase III [Jatrophihabitans sp. GAS493]